MIFAPASVTPSRPYMYVVVAWIFPSASRSTVPWVDVMVVGTASSFSAVLSCFSFHDPMRMPKKPPPNPIPLPSKVLLYSVLLSVVSGEEIISLPAFILCS